MGLRSFLWLVGFGLVIGAGGPVQAVGADDKVRTALKDELLKMLEQDQLHRAELQAKAIEMSKAGTTAPSEALLILQKKQDEIDKRNLVRLEEIIGQHGWPGKSLVGEEAGRAAFLILQHAELKSQQKYFPLLKKAASEGEARASDIAMLEDRILMREGKKQVYGTQVHSSPETKGKLELYSIENEAHVDERRAAVGLPPLADYLKLLGLEYNPKSK
jgi:hypothetical protein